MRVKFFAVFVNSRNKNLKHILDGGTVFKVKN